MDNRFYRIASLVLIVFMLFPGHPQRLPGSQGASTETADQEIAGIFSMRWGDPQGNQTAPRTDFLLTQDDGKTIRLKVNQQSLPLPVSALRTLSGKRIHIQGRWLGADFQVSTLTPEDTDSIHKNYALSGPQPWVTVLCKFNDIAAEQRTAAYFANMYGSSYPGLDHYWRELSYDQINVSGSRATSRWYTLPQPRAYYVYDQDNDGGLNLDFNRITEDCLDAADPEIDYTQFAAINMMFNGDLDGFAWGGGQQLTRDGETRVWPATWVPPWGYADVGVIEHEMGHAFGLPHSSGQYGLTYDNEWDVMSDHWSNCDNSRDSLYGCLGQQTIAYHRSIEGWLPSDRVAVIATGLQARITLEPLENMSNGSVMMVQVPINYSNTRFYTLEVRRKIGYDVKLPGEAVIIHAVDTSQDRPARVVDIDNNGDTGDDGAQWQVGEVFNDAANAISISILATTTSGGYIVSIVNGDQHAPCPDEIHYWKGEYWSNPDLNGNSQLCQDNFSINFFWGSAAPDPTLPAEGFSARWTRALDFTAGTYRFWLKHDGGGVRLYVDNMDTPILDRWGTTSPWEFTTLALNTGVHTIRLAMHDTSDADNIFLFWEPDAVTGWRGEYFNTPNLSGPPALVRDDAEVSFDWALGSPHPLIQADRFSARWQRSMLFDQGIYVFETLHDDGARLFVDGQKVFDNWCSDCRRWDTVSLQMTAGEHRVVYEVWDNQGLSAAQLNISLLDIYEPDNTPDEAKVILSGMPQTHSISPVEDFDYVTFTLAAHSGIVLETSGQTDSDTELWLYDSSLNQIATNDDNGVDHYSRIALTCDVSPLPPGVYYVRVNDYNDNHSIPAYHLALALDLCPMPDLTIDSILLDPAPPRLGQPVTYTVTVRNQGTADVTVPFRVDLYNTNSAPTCGQAGDYSWEVAALPAGASTSLTYSGPAHDSLGPHTVTAFADSSCAVKESEEGNNLSIVTFSLLPGVFSKSAPVRGETDVSITPTLSWSSAAGADGYAYCVDKTTVIACPDGWSPVTGTTVDLSGLAFETQYYWQVRAVNAAGSVLADEDWWSFTTQAMPPRCTLAWKAAVSVRDSGSGSGSVTIGQGAAYTDSLDTGCGESALPAAPPTGIFNARLALPGGAQETAVDFRASVQETAVWVIRFQPGPGGYPMTFNWDPTALPRGTFRLQDLSGTRIDVDMKAQSAFTLADTSITALKIDYSAAINNCVDISPSAGWNLLSMPLILADMKLASLFPDADGTAYAYSGGYQPVSAGDALQTGRGYWVRFAAPRTYHICGKTIASQVVPLAAGWNLIGGLEIPEAVSALTTQPEGIIVQPLFGFDRAYRQAAALAPSAGYWVYATQPGSLALPASTRQTAARSQAVDPAARLDLVITVTSGETSLPLVIGIDPHASSGFDPALDVLLPPPPLEGAFDARLINGGTSYLTDLRAPGTAPIAFVIQFQAASAGDTIRLAWDVDKLKPLGDFTLTGDQISLDMDKTGQVTLQPGALAPQSVTITLDPIVRDQFIYLPSVGK